MKPDQKAQPCRAPSSQKPAARKTQEAQQRPNVPENPYRLPCGRLAVGAGDI